MNSFPLFLERLDKSEEIFKELFFKFENSFLTKPFEVLQYEEYKDIIEQYYPYIQTDVLDENLFIPNGYDIAVIKHIRYFPALMHSHTFIEVIYVYKGQCINNIGNNRFELDEGDLFIISPFTKHCLFVFDDKTIVFNILIRTSTFSNSFQELICGKNILADFFTSTLYSINTKNYIIFRNIANTSIIETLLSMYEEYQLKQPYTNSMLKLYFKLFCIHLLRIVENKLEEVGILTKYENRFIVEILEYLQNYYNTVSLSEIAKKFNYSESHISKLIKKHTGKTFNEILREIRIKKATDLLLHSKLSIDKIAYLVGYKDISNFYKNFKEYFGTTPYKYRQLNNYKIGC